MTLTQSEKENIPQSATPQEALENTYKYVAEFDPKMVKLMKLKVVEMEKSNMHPAQIAYGTIDSLYKTLSEMLTTIRENAIKEAGYNDLNNLDEETIDKVIEIEDNATEGYYDIHIHSFKMQAHKMLWDAGRQWCKNHAAEATKLGFGNNLKEIDELFDKIKSYPKFWDQLDSICMKADLNN